MNEFNISLDRLFLCNFLRQYTYSEYPIIIDDIIKFQKIFRCIQKIALRNSKLNTISTRVSNSIVTIFCWIIIDFLMLLSPNKKYIRQAYKKYLGLRFNQKLKLSSDFTTFIFSAEDERIVLRMFLLMYMSQYYSTSIDILIRRFYSGLPAEETKYWLSFFLEQTNDTSSAKKLLDSIKMPIDHDQPPLLPEINKQSIKVPTKKPLNFGLVMITLGYSEIFVSSLKSLMKSDYDGNIIIIEQGISENRTCEEICKKWNIKYIKNIDINVSRAINSGIQKFDQEVNIIIYSHSDVLWPSKWFKKLESAWCSVIKFNKVYMINLGYWEYLSSKSDILDRLFLLGKYDDLIYILNKLFINKNAKIDIGIKSAQNDNLLQTFGLGKDNYNEMPKELFFAAGRASPVLSFTTEAWSEIGEFDPDMSVGCDLELQLYGLINRKWSLWMSNPPFIHQRGSDTVKMSEKDRKQFQKDVKKTYYHFQERYGITIGHFIYTHFAEILIIYQEEILGAINEFKFDKIDFIFDKLLDRIENKTLNNCEIIFCDSRKNCSRNSSTKLRINLKKERI